MIHTDLDVLSSIAQDALPLCLTACGCANSVLLGFGIHASRLRTEHFWAQVLHESSGLSRFVENLNYSVKRMMVVWPRRFPTLESAQPFANNPVALANKVYGGRLGNVEPGDGWKFIGRGFLQITGRENYAKIGTQLGIDLATEPNLVLTPEYLLPVAAEVWRSSGCNAAADLDSVEAVTRRINGGLIGLDDRKRWLGKIRRSGLVRVKE